MQGLSDVTQLKLSATGLSDVGRVRKSNEDAFLVDSELGVFAVADGMGGHQAGEVAAAMAIEGLRKRIAAAPDTASLTEPTLEHRRQLLGYLAKSVDEINSEIYARGRSDSQYRGMGCTLDVMLMRKRGVYLAHVGDSRAYGLRDGRLYQLTEDHTFSQVMLSGGAMTAEELKGHPQRDQLMRALGVYPQVQIDTTYLDAAQSDVFMLCSDGVHGLLTSEQIGRAMAASPNLAAQALIKLALAAGGRDNATAVVCKVDSCEGAQSIRVGSEEIRRAMAQASLFDGFSESELLRMQKIAIGRVLAPGEVLIRHNELCRDLFLLLSGSLSGWRDDCDHQVASLGPGDPFGEMSLHDAPSLATIRAEGPANILVFPLHEVQLLLKSEIALAAKLTMNSLKRVCERFQKVAEIASRVREAAPPIH